MTSRIFLLLLCLFGIFVNTHTLNPQLINEVINGDFNSFEDQNFLFRDFFFLGVEHILTGWDHLAFLVGLMLIFRRFNLLIAVTCFTLGHSISLAMGSLGFIAINSAWIEALIGFSVALVAIEAAFKHHFEFRNIKRISIIGICFFGIFFLLKKIDFITFFSMFLLTISYLYLSNYGSKNRTSFLLVILFGFIHGFGFSTNLQEYDLLQNDFLKSLLGFNLGVEMGQLLMIGIALIVVMISHRQLSFSHIRLAKVMSISSLLFLGIFWFSYRTLLIM